MSWHAWVNYACVHESLLTDAQVADCAITCICDVGRPSASNSSSSADYPFGAKNQHGPTANSTRHPEPPEGRLRAAHLASLSGFTARLAARATSSRRVDSRPARLGQTNPPYVPGAEGFPAEAPRVPARPPSSRSPSEGCTTSEVQGGEGPGAPRTPTSPVNRSKKGKASEPHARSRGPVSAVRQV